MIIRHLAPKINELLGKYPLVAIIGPRQSGKTTLAKYIKPEFTYVNLEDLAIRNFALNDPAGFIAQYQNGVVIDEVQYAPQLFSYLQIETDNRAQNGEYILTGSQNYLMMEQISQSLAGRIGLLNLFPLSISELRNTEWEMKDWQSNALSGFYPRRITNKIDPQQFYEDYLRTYVERDVRLLKNIENLDLFRKFILLIAGRTGQLLNQSQIGNELGIDNKTVSSWMGLLESSYIAFKLQPYHTNFNKRLVKTPKVYFYDTGLLCYLLGIKTIEQLNQHFAKGFIFENLVIAELIKNNQNFLKHQKFYFWRDQSQNEVDLIVQDGMNLYALEIKSASTFNDQFLKGLNFISNLDSNFKSLCIYTGNEEMNYKGYKILPFNSIDKIGL